MLTAKRRLRKIRGAIGPLMLVVSSILSFGCQGLFNSDGADTKWREDYARCRFGMTLEQLEARNENPDAESLRQNPSWQACLAESGWDAGSQSSLGPQWDD
jgi:hypothetical protein